MTNTLSDKPLRAALYLRVSTQDQDLGNQRPDLEQLAKTRGLLVVGVYEEKVSAAKVRPEFNRMMNDAHAGKFDILVVWALDRLGRSMVGNLTTVLKLDSLGVEVISVKEPWLDVGGPVRSLLIAVFGWVAEQERIRIVERTRAGLEHARAKGVRLGRPKAKVDLDAAVRLRNGGMTLREVAKKLKVGASTLHRMLQGHGLVPNTVSV
jgi:putative DNA-invertase from lambdoid prophage Rac